MRSEHRFASLGGADRKWLVADEIEADLELARDTGAATSADFGDEDTGHDGWKPITLRQRPLARLGTMLGQ